MYTIYILYHYKKIMDYCEHEQIIIVCQEYNNNVFHFCHTFAVSAPTTVILSSSISNPIPPFGSDVTLTCTVELSPAVDVPVTVNTVLTTVDGFINTSTAQPVMGSITNYTAPFMISSFGRSNSGNYTCRATVSLTSSSAYIGDSSPATDSVRVTIGKIDVYSHACSHHVLIRVMTAAFMFT
jgi:hypothetical protein